MYLVVEKDAETNDFKDMFQDISVVSPKNQNIWKERIEFLKSRGVKLLMSGEDYNRAMKEVCKRNKWGFIFHKFSH